MTLVNFLVVFVVVLNFVVIVYLFNTINNLVSTIERLAKLLKASNVFEAYTEEKTAPVISVVDDFPIDKDEISDEELKEILKESK